MPDCRRYLIWIAVIAAAASIYPLARANEQNKAEKSSHLAQASGGEYEVLAKGIVGSPTYRAQFKSAPLCLEFRNWVMGPGQTDPISSPTDLLMELRQGAVTTAIKEKKIDHRQGDFWTMEKDSSLTIQNPQEVGMIRVIYVYENATQPCKEQTP